MLFTIIRHDKPNSVGLRQSERPKHLVYLERGLPASSAGGALLNDKGQQVGSILIIDVKDGAAAENSRPRTPTWRPACLPAPTSLPSGPCSRMGLEIS